MASREVELFQKAYAAAQERWRKKVEKSLKGIEEISTELDPLNAKKEPLTDDEKKRQKELTAQREKAQQAIDTANMELKTELMLLDPPANVKKDEMNELLKWMKKSFEKIKAGLPLTDRFTIQPDADFDWKKLKFKSLGVILKWSF
jgi:predicted transcriptional regulator